MRVHGSLDLECLDVDPSNNAAIIAVGIVAFTKHELVDKKLWLLDPMWSPGTRSESTYRWWMEQEPAIRNRMFTGRDLPWTFCADFSSFVGLNGVDKLWGYPARYDIGHLRALFAAYAQPFPINFRDELDMSTLIKTVTQNRTGLWEELESIRSANDHAHDALADAENQAARLQHLFRVCGLYDD